MRAADADPYLQQKVEAAQDSLTDKEAVKEEEEEESGFLFPTTPLYGFKDLNPQPLKRARNRHQADSVQNPLKTPPVKKQITTSPAPQPTRPSTDTPNTRCSEMMATGGAYSKMASVPCPSPKKTAIPLVITKSSTGLDRQHIKPSQPPEATIKADGGGCLESFFDSLIMKKTIPTASGASSSATTLAIDPPPTAEEIEKAKSTFRSLLSKSPNILGSSDTFEKTLNILVRSQVLGHDLHPALLLFKYAFPSLSRTFNSTKQSKAEVDKQLRQAGVHIAKFNEGLECYQKLKTEEEDAQAEKKATKDQIRMLQLRISQLDDKLKDLLSQKKDLHLTMKVRRSSYESMEVPSLSITKSKLEAELADIDKAWVNLKSSFGNL